jgi:hypothetical protein
VIVCRVSTDIARHKPRGVVLSRRWPKVNLRAKVGWIRQIKVSRDANPHKSASGFFSKTEESKNDQQYLDS